MSALGRTLICQGRTATTELERGPRPRRSPSRLARRSGAVPATVATGRRGAAQ
jgi:hypothetical protein